jgi:hypothetical protein
MRLGENHPLVWNLSIAVSLGTLPVILSVKTVSCGIQETVLAKEHPEPEEIISEPCIPFCMTHVQHEMALAVLTFEYFLITLKKQSCVAI